MDCSKVSYPTARAALIALEAIKRKPARAECAIHACAKCGAFHLTSKRKSRNNKWSKWATVRRSRSTQRS